MLHPATYTLPALRVVPEGVLIKVRAQPGASREEIVGIHGDALKVAVQAPPEKGRANEAIARALARHLEVKPGMVKTHSGEIARDKWFLIESLTIEEVRKRLSRSKP